MPWSSASESPTRSAEAPRPPLSTTISASKAHEYHNCRRRDRTESQRETGTGCSEAQRESVCDTAALSPASKVHRSAALPASGPTFQVGSLDMAETARWLFCSHLRTSNAHYFGAAKSLWVDRLWDAARDDQLVLRCVSLSMLHKRAAVLGRMDWASYFAEKVTLMQDLQACLMSVSGDTAQSHLPLAIVMLAELETRDAKDLPTARIHMNALARLVQIEQLHDLAWRIAVRVDMRQALLSSRRPSLSYWVPSEYKKPLATEQPVWQQAVCSHLARENSRRAPNSDAFPHEGSLRLFRDIHSMAFSWDSLIADEVPPFGHVYNIAYRIRVAAADAEAVKCQDFNDTAVKLAIIALQLHHWVLSRFWVAQSRTVQTRTLRKAFDLLSPDLLAAWQACASSWSLLWILTTLAAARFDICACEDSLLNDILAQVCTSLDICSLPDLVAELKRWPWLQNWHYPRIEMIWMKLSRIVEGAETVTRLSAETAEFAIALKAEDSKSTSWFLGGLEFYSSL